MSNTNKKRAQQLGMPIGTATHRLRKLIMFDLLQQLGQNMCVRCNRAIETVSDLSIEHLLPWLDSNDPINLFFNLDNIGFSHLSCNSGAARYIPKDTPHGGTKRWRQGCRCVLCLNAKNLEKKRYRDKCRQEGRRYS